MFTTNFTYYRGSLETLRVRLDLNIYFQKDIGNCLLNFFTKSKDFRSELFVDTLEYLCRVSKLSDDDIAIIEAIIGGFNSAFTDCVKKMHIDDDKELVENCVMFILFLSYASVSLNNPKLG